MHRIEKGNVADVKGVWQETQTAEKLTILMSCPDCGRTLSLTNYEILSDGRLLPSVVCPYTDCTFHKYCQLIDWPPNSGEEDV